MGSMKLTGAVVLSIVVGFSSHSAVAQSENAKLAPEVKKLLDVGWERSRTGREQAAEQYERLSKMAPNDRRIKYAYALVRLRQMKYREAIVLLDEVLDADHEAFAIRKIRLWLLLMTKQYDRAMVEMPEWAKRLPKKDLEEEAEKPYTEAADFLGRACGYLAEPAGDQVAAAAVSQCRDQILAQLTPQRRAAFDEALRKVRAEFVQATEQAQADVTKAEAEAADQKERKLSELEQRLHMTGETLAKEQARVDTLRKELSEEMKKIAEEDRRLIANLQQTEIAVVQLRRELNILDNRIRQLLEQAEQEQDPLRRQAFLNTASRWQLDRNRVVAIATDRERQHIALRQQRAALLQRGAMAEQRFRQADGRIAQFEKNVQKTQAERTRETGKAVSGQTAAVRHQRRRSTALTTYIPMPFSLEAEAKRVLGWFK